MIRRPALTLLFLLLLSSATSGVDTDIVITEIHYRPDDTNTGDEYLELHNRGAEAVELGAWKLTEAITFNFPAITLAPGAYLLVCRDEDRAREFYDVTNTVGNFGGFLSNSGEAIVLRNSSNIVIDVVVYSDGTTPDGTDPWPTEADGAGPSLELLAPELDNALVQSWGIGGPYTPGRANTPGPPDAGDVVITEIMYQPRKKRFAENLDPRKGGFWWEDGDDPDGEYIEIYNRGTNAVDISGWSFTQGISYELPPDTILNTGEYLVIAANADAIRTRYEVDNVVGNYTGQLSNNGERITLLDTLGLVVDTVRYRDERPWPLAADQTGPSLELLDPLARNDRSDNWRSSRAPEPPEPDFSTIPPPVGEWRLVSVTDVATSNMPDDSHPFFIFLNGSGTWLLDDLQVTAEGGGPNLTPEGSFENGDTGWLKRGNHQTTATTTDESFEGNQAVRIVSTGAGGNSSNSFIWPDITGMVTGESYTISCRVKQIEGASFSFRLSGGGFRTIFEEFPTLLGSQSLLSFQVGRELIITRGTPGEPNTVASTGIPPLARDIVHTPQKPRSEKAVTILATLSGDAAIESAVAEVRIYDPPYASPDETLSLALLDDGLQDNGIAGDGIYGTRLEPQPSQTLVRYRVGVTDARGANWLWPDSAEPNPERAYFVYDGEEETELPAYFLILPPESEATLEKHLALLREDPFTTKIKRFVDATVVIDGTVYDHVGVRHRSDRLVQKHSFKIKFNKTELFRDMSTLDTNYDWPITEKVASNLFYLVGEGQTHIAMEPIRWYENGQFAGVFVAQESPNRSWLRRVGLDEAGEIFKSKASDGCCTGFDPTFPNCPRGAGDFCASDLRWKPHYDPSDLPTMYIKRSDSLGSYQNLEDFILDLRDTPNEELESYLESHTELQSWLYKTAVHVLQPHCDYHAKNYYVTRSPGEAGKWNVIYFDYDLFWGCQMFNDRRCTEITRDPHCSGTNLQARVYDHPELHQMFLRVLDDVARHLLTEETVNHMLDYWFERSDEDRDNERDNVRGIRVTSNSRLPFIKRQFRERRNWILNNFLPSRLVPPENAHPLIEISEPLEVQQGEVSIAWTHSDNESDPSTVNLYWTDQGFSHLVPIPDAQSLDPGSRRNGAFTWNLDVPDLTGRPIYIYAEIDDGQGPFHGRHMSPAVRALSNKPNKFVRGDADDNGVLDITDAIASLEFQFPGTFQVACTDALDVDDNGTIDTNDPLFGLMFQFLGNVRIPAPFPNCGLDENLESPDLGCRPVRACPSS